MFFLLKSGLFTSGALFVVCTIAMLALMPRVIAKGLPSLKRRDVAYYQTVAREIPEEVRTILLLRKIQSISWMVGLGCAIGVLWFA